MYSWFGRVVSLLTVATIIILGSVQPSAAQKPSFTIYFGFDDGPDPVQTPIILDILKKYNVKATFFIEGAHIAGNEAILRRELQEGHHIGNHLISHELNVMAQNHPDKAVLLAKYAATEAAINAALGPQLSAEYNAAEPIKPFRWPGGAVAPFPLQNVITYNWNVTTGDDVAGGITPHQAMLNIMYGYPPHHYYGVFAWGDGAVVLMHDESETLLRVLPAVIENLQANGVTFGTLPRSGDTAGTMPIRIGDVPPCSHKPGNCGAEFAKYPVHFSF